MEWEQLLFNIQIILKIKGIIFYQLTLMVRLITEILHFEDA